MSDNITLPRKHIDYAAHALEHFNKDAPDPLVSEIIHHLRTALAAPRPEHVRCNPADYCAARHMNLYAAPPAAAPRLEVTVDPRMTPDEAAAISSALAAPRQKPEPVAYFDLQKQVFYWTKPTVIDVPMTVALKPLPLYAAPPAAAPEPEKRHPGYIIGSHWLETAYSRVCAGEAEADVLRDCGWERVRDAQALRRDAERLTDEQIDSATSKERDDLLDHIYEYGTAAEGILERIRKLARAAIDAAMKEGT